ncbi:MAG: hypothetical protein AAGA19_14050 [Pseudomonadota bacterium]
MLVRWSIGVWTAAALLFLVALIRDIEPDLLTAPQVWQAVIAGVFLSVGWFVTAEAGRASEARQRDERQQDVQTALRSEISSIRGQMVGNLPLTDGQKMLETLRDAMHHRILTEDLVPFIATENNDAVYRTMLPEIYFLDEKVIPDVVRFYDVLKNIEDLSADLRTPEYAALDAKRRASIYKRLMSMKITLVQYADKALTEIDAVRDATR